MTSVGENVSCNERFDFLVERMSILLPADDSLHDKLLGLLPSFVSAQP